MQHNKVLEFISLVRESFVGSKIIYTEGSCYRFYEILKFVFPKAKPYILKEDHIVIKIEDKFYDITGEVFGDFKLFDKSYIKDLRSEMVYEEITKNRFYFQVNDVQCPECDNIFSIK